MKRIIAALTLAALCAATGSAQKGASPDAQLGAIIQQAQVELDFDGAIPRYKKFIAENANNRQLAAKALYHLGLAYEEVGSPEARPTFERVVKEFPTQKEARFARLRLENGVARETTVRISGNNNVGRFSRPSPDGRYLVGIQDGDGTRYLVLHDLSTNADRRLTRGGFAHTPQFTPDGRRVVFQWAPSGAPSQSGGIHEIRMIDVEGTGEPRTLFRSTLYQQLEVSGVAPDGKTAAVGFNRTDGTWQVGLVSLDTGKPTILKNNEWRDTYVGNFSADGRWLVYWVQGEDRKFGEGGIYALATDGSGQRLLIPRHATDDTPYFSPDGSRVVFVSAKRQELRSIPVADGSVRGAQEIVSSGAYTQLLGFSRDGSLYFTQQRGHASVFVTEVNPANWKALGAPAEVSSPDSDKGWGAAAWSPDGQVLAYQLWPALGSKEIVLHRFDGTPEREVSFSNPVVLHRWSSDGRLLISSDRDLKFYGLNFYDVGTGREHLLAGEKQLLEVGERYLGQRFAADERAVYYFTIDKKEAGAPDDSQIVRLMRADINTGERRELHRLMAGNAPPRLFRLQVSPDGRSLAFGFPNTSSGPDFPSQSAVLVPLSGGAPRPLPGFAAWTPDSKAVLFEKSRGQIWVQPIDGGEMYSTGIRFDASWDELGVAVHPDGRRIAMTWRVNTYDVAVIRNLFSTRSPAR